MNVAEILEKKGSRVVTTVPDTKIADLAALLKAEGIGAALVKSGNGAAAGIISERDIARGLAEHGAGLPEMTVGDLMTTSVITCAPDTDTGDLMEQMLSSHIRHLPVFQDGALVGIVSIGDVVQAVLTELKWVRGALEEQLVKSTVWSTDED